MKEKKIIACLDVKDGKLVKGVKFVDTKEIGDPVERAKEYTKQGLDELVFYDITATSDNKDIMIDLIKKVAEQTTIPFSVGGGIKSIEDCQKVIAAGAQKININSAAVKNPQLISDCAEKFGTERVVLAMDVKQVEKTEKIPTGYEVVINGGRTFTGIDAIEWAKCGQDLGAGELVVNSIDADGTKDGYDINLTRQIADAVSIPVVASGGAGKPEHLADVLTIGGADTALIATMIHYGEYTVAGLKKYLLDRGIKLQNTEGL